MILHLTGEDLGYKSGVVEQVNFEYSPLGKVFNKGLGKKKTKKKDFWKGLKLLKIRMTNNYKWLKIEVAKV